MPPSEQYIVTSGAPSLAWLERVNRLSLLSRLVATTLHDMNNALQVIGGGLELLQMQPVDLASVTRAVGGKTERANVLLQDLSRFMRDTGGTEEPVELRALAEHALALRHFALGRLRATFTVDGSALVIATVRRDVLQILLNLVVNSEAALRGVPNPALRIVVASSDRGATIAVEDNGKGVSPDQRESLFDRREAAGDGVMSPLGIGLAVSRALAERRGGALTYTPREPDGSIFTLTIRASGS